MPSYFERLDDERYRPTAHTGGAWDPDEQHFSPLGGLIVHAIERALAPDRSHLRISRLSFDILGRIATEDFAIHVATIRPGRTIELVEATVVIGERSVVRGRAWLLIAQDTTKVAGGGAPALPDPDQLASLSLTNIWFGGYVASLDVRPVVPRRPGRGTAWVATEVDLLPEEPIGPLARYVGLVDTANGVAVRAAPGEWMFPNVDLTIHLHRQPRGRWVGLDTTVVFGPDGQGVTSTVLHDRDGQVGHAQQMLTVRRLQPG